MITMTQCKWPLGPTNCGAFPTDTEVTLFLFSTYQMIFHLLCWKESMNIFRALKIKGIKALLHFDQKSDGRIVGFSTLPCHMYDTMIFFKRRWIFVGYPTSFQFVDKATPQFTVG